MSEMTEDKDLKSYSVYGLLVAASRFTDDYDEDDAVRQYLELHPCADPVAVREELANAIAKPTSM